MAGMMRFTCLEKIIWVLPETQSYLDCNPKLKFLKL